MITGAHVIFNADGTVDITGTSSFPTTEPFFMLIGADKNTAIVNGVQSVTKDDPITSPTTTTAYETTATTTTATTTSVVMWWTTENITSYETTTGDYTTTISPPSHFSEIVGDWVAIDKREWTFWDTGMNTIEIIEYDTSGRLF